jgi:N-acetylmuramoyl-L-alanine amidase
MLFLLALLTCLPARADAPRWLRMEKQAYLRIQEWTEQTKFSSFVDAKSGRILFERKNFPPVILLLGSPYALLGSKFVALPDSPFPKDGRVYLSAASAERLFPVVLPKEERAAFAEFLFSAKIEPKPPVTEPVKQKKQETAPTIPSPLSSMASCQLERPVKKIFLDPGHGGNDAGTKFGSAMEKNITLGFSRLVADELRRRGFEVSFSRTRDVFLPLDIRTKLAEKWKADLFVSIHVNSSQRSDAHGTETYILNQEATDAEARKLALIENSIASSAKERQSAVQDILWDMEQTAYLQDSAYLASYLQGALVTNAHDLLLKEKIAGDWKNRGVRQAPFYVLNRAAMPAVLVELGYLSNPRDRKLLLTKSFQESLAKALADGVKKYKEECRKAQ